MKKSEDFLIATKLGEKGYELPKDGKKEEQIVLSIEEGGVPLGLLKGELREKLAKRRRKSFFAKLSELFESFGRVKPKDLATFFRLLSVMVDAGLPIMKSLDVIAEQTVNRKLKQAIFESARMVEKGKPLSSGMERFPRIFDEAEVGMVRAGEASGQLNNTLRQLALQIEKVASVYRKVRGALIYPLFVITVLVIVVSIMMIAVVPKIVDVFSGTGVELPFATKALIAVSKVIEQYWYLFLLISIAIPTGVVISRRTPGGKYFWDNVLIHLPLFGNLFRKAILTRFANNLGNLLSSGIPIIQALKIDARSVGNEVYRDRIELSAEDISQGIPLGENLRDSKFFPPTMVQMIAIGEQTAQLDTLCQKIAQFYEEEVDTAIQALTKILEPFVIVLVGITVGGIVAAIMLPMIQLANVSQLL